MSSPAPARTSATNSSIANRRTSSSRSGSMRTGKSARTSRCPSTFTTRRPRSLPDDGITGGGETAFSVAGKVPSTCLEFYAPNPADPTATIPCRNASNFWTQTFSFNNGLPVAARTLFPTQLAAYAGTGGNSDYSFGPTSLGSQILRIAYQDQTTDIKQSRIDGKFDMTENSTLGVRRRDARHGFAAARFRHRTSPWVTGAWATAAPCPTWWRC